MKLTKKLILGSNSPRRKEILSKAGFDFEVVVKPTDENFDDSIDIEDVPVYLAQKKIACFNEYSADYMIICADTVVISDNKILNKPVNSQEAVKMLQQLSGKTHKVITGVSIKINKELINFSDVCLVTFDALTDTEIAYYVANHSPFDKAGAYGVQEFIGMIGISKLEGSFYTVMGLPIHQIYKNLKEFIVLK